MDLVHGLVFVCIFLIGLCAVTHYFRNSPLPPVCWMLLVGVGYGILQGAGVKNLPMIQLNPDVILFIFLPVLIFDSSRKLNLPAAQLEAVPSVILATLGILASMFVMAVPIRLFSVIPWLDILLFCGIMSATDPVAVTAVFRDFPVPERLKMLIEGESLLNDGTTVILFALLFGSVFEGHSYVFGAGALFFLVAVAGAVLIGVVGGAACIYVMRRWEALKNHFIGPLMPLLSIYLVFCTAQAGFDVSGVIAVMAATLTMKLILKRYPREELPGRVTMEFYRNFWDFFGELANGTLFFLLGVEFVLYSGDIAWKLLLVSLLALLLSRAAVIYAFGGLFWFTRFRFPVAWMHVLNMGGLKGALSVALILLIPAEYRYRHVFLCAALVMCVFTLVIHPLLLRVYLKKAGLSEQAG